MTRNQKKKSPYRVGIYIRVSTEEQAENPEGSIKNQEQRLREYVKMRNYDENWGEIVDVFNDPGISAKDMKRPALQRMLAMIRRREINLVLVTEISRLTRSTKDFANIWDFLKEHDCQFQSLRDNFDTTTPAGEMILFTLANFAQFERKQLGERVANAFLARAKRGLWNGGSLPLGYAVDPQKPGHLMVVENEAEIVKDVFATFMQEETLAQTGKSLNSRGVRVPKKPRNGGSSRQGHFNIELVYRILTNKAYIGRRVFTTRDGQSEVDATWPAIIDDLKFQRVQKMLSENKNRKKPFTDKRYPYTLSGLLVCQKCGDRMCGRSANGNGGKIAYYEHSWTIKSQNCLPKKVFACNPNRVLAHNIEPVVWDDVKRLLSCGEYAEALFAEAKELIGHVSSEAEQTKLKAKIANLQGQIEATTERISELPKGIDASAFYNQILRLQEARDEQQRALDELKLKDGQNDVPLSLGDFKEFARGLKQLLEKVGSPEIRAAICRKVIQRIEVLENGIAIFYYVGSTHYRSLEDDFKKMEAVGSEVQGSVETNVSAGPFFMPKPSRPLERYQKKGIKKPPYGGSTSLTIGWGGRTRTYEWQNQNLQTYQLVDTPTVGTKPQIREFWLEWQGQPPCVAVQNGG